MRLLPAVGSAQIGKLCSSGVVAILVEFPGFDRAARPEVHRDHRLDSGRPAPVDKFVGPERVRLSGHPRELPSFRAFLERPHSIFPLVPGDEIAARIPHDCHAEFPDEFEHIATESVLVSRRMAGLVDAAVNRPSEMLDERSEQARIGFPNNEPAVEVEIGHGWVLRSGTPGIQ